MSALEDSLLGQYLRGTIFRESYYDVGFCCSPIFEVQFQRVCLLRLDLTIRVKRISESESEFGRSINLVSVVIFALGFEDTNVSTKLSS